LCTGSQFCLELMLAYAVAVVVALVMLTLLLIAGLERSAIVSSMRSPVCSCCPPPFSPLWARVSSSAGSERYPSGRPKDAPQRTRSRTRCYLRAFCGECKGSGLRLRARALLLRECHRAAPNRRTTSPAGSTARI
jgi:hypothetical protein